MDKDQLAALDRAATQGVWNHLGYCGQDGNIQGPRQEQIASLSSAWGKSDQTGHQCFANAAFIVALVNAYRTGKLVLIDDGAVERASNAFCDVFSGGNAPTADDMPNPAIYREAMSAALSALGVK